ncbi:hypothetical protein B0H13DRAFT_2334886 [Mycena leptocephala]|nr:hypothetical protein B0H13DRAFT_2334886 [Mycena leptocephala]
MRIFIPFTLAFLATPSFSLYTRATGSSISAQNATVQSLVYGIPLTEYVLFANYIANDTGTWTTNVLDHENSLANASYHTIGDVIANMPALEDGRFYVWPFYDVYGNNVCNIGTITNSTAGKNQIKYRPSNPGCVGASREYAGTIYLPTVYGATLLRIEVSNSTDIDYVVSSIQPNFSLEADPHASASRAPALTAALLNGNLDTSDVSLHTTELTARVAAYDPPEVAADVKSITATLEAAGISMATHTYTKPADVDLDLAYSAAQAILGAVPKTPADLVSLGGGWMAFAPAVCGDFLSHYDIRAFVAVDAYLQLQAAEAIYPFYPAIQNLYANQTYMMKFSGKPQVAGFWSLTMYGSDGFLVANSINRYSLNNRGNMTYPDGTLVYGGESPVDSIEPFYMLLQSTDVAASPDWESNWLPTPADGGESRFYLRWYGPTDTLTDGRYVYPTLTAVEDNPPFPSSN